MLALAEIRAQELEPCTCLPPLSHHLQSYCGLVAPWPFPARLHQEQGEESFHCFYPTNEEMPHDDAACCCLAAALREQLIPGKRRPSRFHTSMRASWTRQCWNSPWRMQKIPHREALTAAEFARCASFQLRMLGGIVAYL